MFCLVKQLHEFHGKFGGAHIHCGSSPAGLICMFILFPLFLFYDAGCIILLEVNITIFLNKFWTIYFSRLRWHTGSMSTAPPSVKNVPLCAVRIAMVSYLNFTSFNCD